MTPNAARSWKGCALVKLRTTRVVLLSALVASCSSAPVILPPEPAPLPPPLPESARQGPQDPRCSPTCSDFLKSELDTMLRSPTTGASAASSVKPTTTR